MPTKKKAIKRRAQSAKRRDQNASNASIEEQIALLEAQIALLQAQSADTNAKRKDQSKVANQNHSAQNYYAGGNSALRSALPKAGPNPLPAPTLVIMSVSSSTILVDWDKVTNANGYIIEVANDSLFTNPVSLNADAAATSFNIDGLNANTSYYIRVMATGTGAHGNSGFSNVQSIKTLNDGSNGMDDGVVGDLQSWLDDLQTMNQHFLSLLPNANGEVLSSAERRRLRGSGVRRYGYIDKVSDTAEAYPQFWPAFVTSDTGTTGGEVTGAEKLKEMIREIEVLRNLLIAFRFGVRVVEDMLLTAGDDAFRMANMYYRTVRDAARNNIPEAGEVFQMLELFWKRRRRMTDEPTEHEVERDVRALMRGTKVGNISVSNESDQVTRGEKVFVDNTFPAKQHGGVKVMENGEISRQ